MIRNKKAQSTLEYAIITAVVVGALLAMQIYIKRGMEGRMRSSTDSIGEQFSAGSTTYKKITKYGSGAPQHITVDRVGLGAFAEEPNWGGADLDDYSQKGISYNEVNTAAITIVSTGTGDGGVAESVHEDLADEDLFNKQGTLFDDD